MKRTLLQKNATLFMLVLAARDHLPFKMRGALPKELNSSISHLRTYGYCILKDLLEVDNVQKIVEFIDGNLSQASRVDTDRRIMGAERISPLIHDEVSNHSDILKLSEYYLSSSLHLQMTMAAKLEFAVGNLGSGQGWHRDSYSRQIKSMIYLSDVGHANGPFEYLEKSHMYINIMRELKLKKEQNKWNTYTRFSDNFVQEYRQKYNLKAKKICAPKGTILIFDSRGVHRGSPIQDGSRYAVTNYFIKKTHHQGDQSVYG